MGYYDRDQEMTEQPRAGSIVTEVLTGLVRLTGILLLFAGLVLATLLMIEVWALYKHPERIETFAQAVERGSNLDKAFAPRGQSAPAAGLLSPLTQESVGEAADTPTSPGEGSTSVRLSYFFAWFIVLALVLVIAWISLAAVSTGGRLALYDTEVKRFARALIHETRPRGRQS